MGLRDMSLCNIKREVSEHDKESSLLSVYIGVERHVSMQCRERCLCAVLRDMSLCPKERSPDNLKKQTIRNTREYSLFIIDLYSKH